jgi:hypothetical protein
MDTHGDENRNQRSRKMRDRHRESDEETKKRESGMEKRGRDRGSSAPSVVGPGLARMEGKGTQATVV